MKQVVVAALIALGSGAAAQAFPLPTEYRADTELLEVAPAESSYRPYHRCYGRMTGQAHHSCGTQSGGPVGGLF